MERQYWGGSGNSGEPAVVFRPVSRIYRRRELGARRIGRRRILLRFGPTVTKAPASRCEPLACSARTTISPMAVGKNVLCADLDHAWLATLSVREKRAEIEIVSEDDQPVCTGVIHDLRVRCGRPANAGPMNTGETRIGWELDPQRAQVHIDQKLHAAGSGTSISSTRQAAYARACRMSSASR